MQTYKLAVDTGGTFTDLCLQNEETGELKIAKVPSTPDNPSRAIIRGLEKICKEAEIRPANIGLLLHGTTVATNALLEGKGGPTALITTKGFRDILYIGRQNRPDLYNFKITRNAPPVPRELILEVDERIGPGGKVIRPLNRENAVNVVTGLQKMGIKSVAVCFLHAYANPDHERQMARLIEEFLPGIPVTLSSNILPEFREYERTSTTVINALVQPLMQAYLEHLEKDLKNLGFKGGLFIMQSNGGVITAAQARRESARTVLSGPAAGVLAGKFLSRLTGRKNLITADMGGTSMDMCLIANGEPQYTTEGVIGGHPLRLPMLDIHTLGAGGGSIAWIDPGGALKVGPQSAGAVPGPACYGKGGFRPTVTDANVVLGRLSPGALPGDLQPDAEASRYVIEKEIARPLGMDVETAAEGIIRVVNAGMVRSMRVISVHRGHDPREFTLLAFGGAGPLHAVELARELGAPRVMIPPYPGVTSAFGMLAADVRRDYVQAFLASLAELDPVKLNELFNAMEREARRELAGEGFNPETVDFIRLADLRYSGQSYEISLEVPRGNLIASDLQLLQQSFHQAHNQQYGYLRKEAPVEIVAARLVALGILPTPALKGPTSGSPRPEAKTARPVIFHGRKTETPIYDRSRIGPGATVAGPAVIEQGDSTTLLWPGDKARCDKWGNLIIEVGVK